MWCYYDDVDADADDLHLPAPIYRRRGLSTGSTFETNSGSTSHCDAPVQRVQVVDLRWHWKNYDGNSRGEPMFLVTDCKYWLKQATFNLECVNNIDDVAFEVESTVVRTRVRNLQPVDGDAHLLLWFVNICIFYVYGWWTFTFGNDLCFFRFLE